MKLPHSKAVKIIFLSSLIILTTGSTIAAYSVLMPTKQADKTTPTTQTHKTVPDKVIEQPVATQETSVEPKRSTATPQPTTPAQPATPAQTTEQKFNPYLENTAAWYVYQRRIEVGLPIKVGLGSNCMFTPSANQFGYTVDQVPTVYAIVQVGRGTGGCIIGVVESVASDSFSMSTYVESYQSTTTGVSIMTFTNDEITAKTIMFAR